MRREDRSLAISDHAVDRFRERTGAMHLPPEECRKVIRQEIMHAMRCGAEEEHYVRGQSFVRIVLLGVTVCAVIGRDTTGWSNTGKAVTTILTPEQLAHGPKGHGRG